MGTVTWVGGVLRHNELARFNGAHLFWRGLVIFGLFVWVRGWLLPLLVRKKPAVADATPVSPAIDPLEDTRSVVERLEAAALPLPTEKSLSQRILRVGWPVCFIALGVVMVIWPDLLDGYSPHQPRSSYSFSLRLFNFVLYKLWGGLFGVVLIAIGVASIHSWILGHRRAPEINWPR